MKYPRTARIFRGQLDAAPFAGMLFLLLIFVLMTSLVYTPGIQIELPSVNAANAIPGPDKPAVVVAVDAKGRYFYQNELIEAGQLREQLAARVKAAPEPLALIVRADKAVTLDMINSLTQLARDAGIREAWPAILPRLFDSSGAKTNLDSQQ